MRSKRVRAAQNKGRRGQNANDRISNLPDELLIYILCFMPLKDAFVTSAVSTRWRYLSSYLTSLNFADDESLAKISNNPQLRVSERHKYIDRVNTVIRQFKAPSVHDFLVRYDLDESSETAIDKWIEFAISKKVRVLELDFLEYGVRFRHPDQSYVFEKTLLDKRVGFAYKWPLLNVMTMKVPFLTKLVMKSVTVGEETLAILLKYCPVLEALAIHGSGYLTNVNIGGMHLMLKHLEIVYCFGVESIRIYDMDLVSFIYEGSGIDLRLSRLPKLEEVNIAEENSWFANNGLARISPGISNLRVLTLDIFHPEESLKLNFVPEMPNVKKLILKVGAWNDDCLLEFTSLARACPSLQAFAMELAWFSPLKRRRKVREVARHPHQHLEAVEVVGYYGRISDLELVVYFMDNAVALKKILIDPRCKGPDEIISEKDRLMKEKAARASAKRQLEPRAPPGVELVIL